MQMPVFEDQNIGKVVCPHLKAHVFASCILHWSWLMIWVHSAPKIGKSIRGTDIYDCQDRLQSMLFATPPTTTATKSTSLSLYLQHQRKSRNWWLSCKWQQPIPGLITNWLVERTGWLCPVIVAVGAFWPVGQWSADQGISSKCGLGLYYTLEWRVTTTEHGCGPMECRPRDLVQVWARSILYFIVFASLPHQKRKTAMS